nr:immunoglobulin heavy chain junction region [Mus musculus]
CAEGTFAYW